MCRMTTCCPQSIGSSTLATFASISGLITGKMAKLIPMPTPAMAT